MWIPLLTTGVITSILIIYANSKKKRKIEDELKEKDKKSIEKQIDELTKKENVNQNCIFDFIVAGTYFTTAQDKVSLNLYTKVGDNLKLIQDPLNKVDKKAIQIYSEHGRLGYIPAYLLSHFYTPAGLIRRHKAFIINIDGRVGDLYVRARVIFVDGKGSYYL